ncbi:MAG: 23S rRNA (uracil(1939)-C(5))-methyltransferase RlmD [Oligoflexales bacterium]|nr:23S rRNA (uracil(1939)-C(5))-methyltransferase RlmD [Oligoflexales bacterium]
MVGKNPYKNSDIPMSKTKRPEQHASSRPATETLRRRGGGRTNSPSRSDSFDQCAIKHQCRSCKYVNEPYLERLKQKHQDGLKVLEEAGVLTYSRQLPPNPSPKPLAYRGVAKLAVRKSRDTNSPFSIGLFKPGTHEVVDISRCPLHIPAINQCIRYLSKLLNESSIQAWDEESKEGDLRYLVVRAAHKTGELSLTFVCTDDSRKLELKEIVKKLKETHKIHGAHLNIHPTEGNQIFGDKTLKLSGSEKLRESLCDLKFEISPRSFFQVNPWQAEKLYRRLEQLIGSGNQSSIAWDLYSGVGPIAMILARSAYQVLSIEENPDAVQDAKYHFQINNLEKAEFLTGRVEHLSGSIPTWAKAPDIIVANPSRAGIAEETRTHLKRILSSASATQLFYVSCDVGTLARDLKDLTASGYKVRQIEAFDMFAQTDKLEWLAVMTK